MTAEISKTGSGALFVVSGPSGAGKGTLVTRLLEQVPHVWVSISMTTREPRDAEVDGVNYFFVDEGEFEKTIEEDGFIEWARVHDHYYGTPVEPIRQHLAAGDSVILEIDVQGGFQVRERFAQAHLVFIAPPSLEVLERRLRGRATDSEEAITRRMANAVGEMKVADRYDVVIVNDDLEKATAELVEVVKSHVGRQTTA